MTLETLLTELEAQNITLTLSGNGEHLHYGGDVPPRLLVALAQHKRELIAHLRRRETSRVKQLEAQADSLLARCADTDPATWAAQWARVHDHWGIRCFGFPTWAAWAADVAAGVRQLQMGL